MHWLNPACPAKGWWSSQEDETAYLSTSLLIRKVAKRSTAGRSPCPIWVIVNP